METCQLEQELRKERKEGKPIDSGRRLLHPRALNPGPDEDVALCGCLEVVEGGGWIRAEAAERR
jgi:hypothetical protein